jgi:hypothetical protein
VRSTPKINVFQFGDHAMISQMRWKKIAIAAGFTMGLLALWLLGGNFLAAQQEKTTRKTWAALVAKFPAKSANASAQKLDRLAAKLSLSPLYSDKVPPSADANRPILEQLFDYNKQQVARPNALIDEPPAELQRYYVQHATNLAEIRNTLLQEASPAWDQPHLDHYFSNPYPAYWNLLQLHQIFIFEALQHTRQRNSTAAYQSLKAAWKLSQSLHDRPDMFANVVATETANARMGVLRKLKDLPPQWSTELDIGNAPQAFLNSMQISSFLFSETYLRHFLQWNDPLGMGNGGYPLAGTPSHSTLVTSGEFLLNPYFRFAALDYQAKLQPLREELAVTNVCNLTQEEIDQLGDRTATWWSPAGWHQNSRQYITPELLKSWLQRNEQVLHWELTQKVQQLNQVVKATGSLPQTIPGFDNSELCPQLIWTYQPSGNGEVTVTLENPPVWITEFFLPLRFQGAIAP